MARGKVSVRARNAGTILSIFLVAAAGVRADVIYVDANAVNSANDGTSWADAYLTLQSALAIANSGDEIWVASGVYNPDQGPSQTPGDRAATFQLINGVAIYGGFAGSESSTDQRDWEINETILSGDLDADDGPAFTNNTENSYHVINGSGINETARLDGFIISGGHADGPSMDFHRHGGGMLNEWGNPTVTNCTFIHNKSSFGGGIYNSGRSPTITNCRFIKNDSGVGGGILCMSFSDPILTNCIFLGNHAGGGGGGLAYYSSPVLTNCTFVGNTTAAWGGAMYDGGYGNSIITNCTLLANSAAEIEGGGSGGGGIYCSTGLPTLRNCILWYNTAPAGPQIDMHAGSVVTVSFCNIQGGQEAIHDQDGTSTIHWNDGNIDAEPKLSPNGHLGAGSSCIDAGTFTQAPSVDRDDESRPNDVAIDIGSDEFVDTDGDNLPDWWEEDYFGSSTVAIPSDDPDGDALSNKQEYEEYGSNPIASPHHIYSWWFWTSIQQIINQAVDGDTILVHSGTYSGTGDSNLDYQGKSIVVRAVDGPGVTTIDCGGTGRAINPDTIKGSFAVIEGFTILNGQAALGGGIQHAQSRLAIRNCVLVNNTATDQGQGEGGGIYSKLGNLTIRDLTIQANMADPDKADAGVFASAGVNLLGELAIEVGRADVLSSWFDGVGNIDLSDDTMLRVTGMPGDQPTWIRVDMTGTGDIQIDAGQQLIIGGDAVVDLSGSGICNPDNSSGGRIIVEGSLVLRDSATIQNTNVDVRLLDSEGSSTIQFNNIFLQEASAGFGGEFFVTGNSTVNCNTIISEGDRYLDLDPDAAAPKRPTITNNQISVIIQEGTIGSQGTLLELRAADYDTGGSNNPAGESGAFAAAGSPGFTADPSENWVLEELEILPNAKLNLTDRQGFEFHGPGVPETVYVKNLILRQNAVLNTALQPLYYENITMEEGSRIADEPLLGFSLGVIAMNDPTPSPSNEFDIRVRKRLADLDDFDPGNPLSPLPEGIIELLMDVRDIGDGVMEIKTLDASSVAAKGAFARACEDEIVIAFEYLFIDNGDAGNAELLVSLSDNREVGISNVEVARVVPPSSGRAGAVGSGKFAVFYGVFPRGTMNFTRGTYVELELRGKGACIQIDNWDPQIECIACSDLNGNTLVDNGDYLLLLSEMGQTLAELGPAKYCLDNGLSNDQYVDVFDLLAWDTFLNNPALNACGTGSAAAMGSTALLSNAISSSQRIAAENSAPAILIAGKPNGSGQQEDFLYSIETTGTCLGAQPSLPAGGEASRSNGRLVKDGSGNIYQIHGEQGLLKFDGQVVVGPSYFPDFDGKGVYVGLNDAGGGNFVGFPLLDVTFCHTDDTVLYVVPVLVAPSGGGCPYKAAAKLQLQGGGNYNIVELYGMNPTDDPSVTITPLYGCRAILEPDVQQLREIEVDAFGNLFVLSAQALNANDWVLMYDELTGTSSEQRVLISSFLEGPTAMLASRVEDKLYLASSVNALQTAQTRVFCFDIQRSGNTATGLILDETIDIQNPTNGDMGFGHLATITSIQQAPGYGTLYVTGFTMPRFDPDKPYDDPEFDPSAGSIMATPTFAIIPPGSGSPIVAAEITCHDLALPISTVFQASEQTFSRADFNEDGHVDQVDYDLFEACVRGPEIPQDIPNCQDAKLDGDADVDQSDFGIFQRCYSGTELADPNCAD